MGPSRWPCSQHVANQPERDSCCRAAIEKLRSDNAALKEELRLENKFSVQPTLANASALIQNLKEQSDVYTKKVLAKHPLPLTVSLPASFASLCSSSC